MKCRSSKKDAMCISGTTLWCRDLFNGMKHKSLCISEREKFPALPQRLDLICVSTDGSVFWLSVCDTVRLRIHLQKNWNCWLAIQSLSSRLLYSSLCLFSSSDLIETLKFAAASAILLIMCFCLQIYKIIRNLKAVQADLAMRCKLRASSH